MKTLRRVLLALCRVVVPMLAGAALAMLLVPLYVHWTQPYWVATFEAVGTWVGGLATMGALIWAVLVFRGERELTQRELAQDEIRVQAERDEADRRAAAEAQAKVDRAALVEFHVFPGGGYGVDPNAKLTNVNVQHRNRTESVVHVEAMVLDAPYELVVPFVLSIGPNRGGLDATSIKEAPSTESEFQSSQEIGALVEYLVDGARWTRRTVGDTDPRQCSIDQHPHAVASAAS